MDRGYIIRVNISITSHCTHDALTNEDGVERATQRLPKDGWSELSQAINAQIQPMNLRSVDR